ncbi:unnamed protein product [Chondrus crispus]|uniref:Uncharacterized protein n=1 Tax=Chondrus crispus TaxID=2769 RepID=R7Q419_CHOCR|nr:unnamed protein product [Chondrus crispus]CDF32081.1 unnamed protein product [Chondrus crispus]|eukprot:XP_005711746.1 unnamed protein product [Chondrus crispus]
MEANLHPAANKVCAIISLYAYQFFKRTPFFSPVF